MNKTMNPNYPQKRGCFLDKRTPGKVFVVDYPTWSSKNGCYVHGELNAPIEEGKESSREFTSIEAANEFCEFDHYVICADPWVQRCYQPTDNNSDFEEE